MIDHTAFPHLMDEIISYCSREALLVLAQTSKLFLGRTADLLYKHIALVHLHPDYRIPADPEDDDADFEDLRLWDKITQKKVDRVSENWESVTFCSIAHAPPMSASAMRHAVKMVDIHYMPVPEALIVYTKFVNNIRPQLEVVRLLNVQEDWEGECPIVAPTFVVFFKASMDMLAELPNNFLFPPKGIKKFVINHGTYKGNSYVGLAHRMYFTTIPESVEEVVYLLVSTDILTESTPTWYGTVMETVFAVIIDAIKWFPSKKFTLVVPAEDLEEVSLIPKAFKRSQDQCAVFSEEYAKLVGPETMKLYMVPSYKYNEDA